MCIFEALLGFWWAVWPWNSHIWQMKWQQRHIMGWKWNSDKDKNISKIQMKTWVPPLLYAKWHWFWIFDYWHTCSHLRGPLCWRNQTKQPRHLKNLCNSWPTRLQGDYDHWKYSHDQGSLFLNGMDQVWAQV